MATTKVTFTLDAPTLARLRATAERLARPKSEVVRLAIQEFSERAGRLGEEERRRLLATFDRVVPRIPKAPQAAVARELDALRRSRRNPGRGGRSPR
jgi:hypothetical protein